MELLIKKEMVGVSLSISNEVINKISTERTKLGGKKNALDHVINNVNNISENLSSAESRITDADMANEMMEFTKYNILKEATQSMLSQAKTMPEQVLNLLRNT